MPGTVKGIGTEKESSLHAALKVHYAGRNGKTEVEAEGYVCDAVTSAGEVIEIQTGSFGPLKRKAVHLARTAPVRIVHPIAAHRYIETYDAHGALLRRRLSPKKGTHWDIFAALIHAPFLPATPNLTIELAMVDIIEKRILDGTGSWRRKGARIAEKELAAYRETIPLSCTRDYRRFLPFSPEAEFTVKDLSEIESGPTEALARKALYVLHKMGLVERVGKRGNAFLYACKI